MKKLFALMILGSIILGAASANDLQKAKLFGKVHTLNEESWSAVQKFGEYVKGELLSKESFTYDGKGNLTEWSRYNADGSLDYKYIFTYDGKGNLTEKSDYKADGSLDYKDVFTYDNKGNLTEWSHYDANRSLENKYTYEYDHWGNWIKQTKSIEVNKFGKVYLEPIEFVFRKITYYP